MIGVAVVLAHQGGWDEAILVALPLVVLAALLRMARRRALQEEAEAPAGGEGSGDRATAEPEAAAGPDPAAPPRR